MAALKDVVSNEDSDSGKNSLSGGVKTPAKARHGVPAESKVAPKKGSTRKTAARSEPTQEELETKKRLNDELDRIHFETTKLIVPMWFGQTHVRKAFKNQLCAEAALCLMFIGAMEPLGHATIVSMEMRLAPSGFDREERWLLAHMGTMSLIGAKLAKFAKKPENTDAEDTAKLVLTKKGRDLFELVKKNLLHPYEKKSSPVIS